MKSRRPSGTGHISGGEHGMYMELRGKKFLERLRRCEDNIEVGIRETDER
jgi:hypothetical protein